MEPLSFLGETPKAKRAEIRGQRPRAGVGFLVRSGYQLEVWGGAPRPQIHVGPTKSLEKVSSGRKRRAQFIFY